tara:strand:+ start:389 stop:748 length:360 start_codon:yes stop_codon:yes gene_type:complete
MADIKRIIEEYLQEQMLPMPFDGYAGSVKPNVGGEPNRPGGSVSSMSLEDLGIDPSTIDDDYGIGTGQKPNINPPKPENMSGLPEYDVNFTRKGKGNTLNALRKGDPYRNPNIGGSPKP